MEITYSNFVVTDNGDMPLEEMEEEEKKKAGDFCRCRPLAVLGQLTHPRD